MEKASLKTSQGGTVTKQPFSGLPEEQMTMGRAVQSNDGSSLSELMDESPVRRDDEMEDAAKQDAGSLASVPAEDNGLDFGPAVGAAEDEDAGYMADMLCAADVRLASQERLLCLPAARRSFPPRSLFTPPADPVCVCVPVSDNNSPISVPVTSTPVSRVMDITGSPSPSSTSTTSTTTTTATTAASSSSSVLGAPSAVLSSSSATADPVSSRVSTAVPGGHVSVSVPPSRPPSKSRPAPSVVTVAVPVPDRSPIYTRSLAAKKKKAASSPAPAIAPIRVATQTFYNSERRRSVGGASAVVAAVPPSSAIVPVDNSKSSCGTSVSVAGTPVNAPTDRPQPTANPSAAPVCEKNLSPTSRPAPAPVLIRQRLTQTV
ncbi:unnamed protein product [Dimorphilus gyrociliatus]|uniref:Uncharacterized protein n=1 Tax=Dimorphilus gyrociliatus TaxID=2664684 RepID=A0A7I8WCP5_9ANNE|nr:unnamed protein product [Dimorphilus gyrociliatus]